MDLFASSEAENLRINQPLAARMRPQQISEFIGQLHLLGPGKLLRRLIDARQLSSLIFFGPPGSGKTTLAHLIAQETGAPLRPVNAVTSGVKELREVLAWARDEVASGGRRPVLFVDEIHRFNRSQQDALLPDVESGVVSLIGATTSNPYFSVNGALLSRSQLFQLNALTPDDLVPLLQRALTDRRRGLGFIRVETEESTLRWIAEQAEGDARRALSVLEIAVLSSGPSPVHLTIEVARESMQRKQVGYDASGDEHYDQISALIKSIRGSDVDASIYWLARMLESGEDIRFLCRRLVILASEDIGNADPQSLVMAVAAMQACEMVGLPECQLTLSQTVAYLALAPKSNAATTAIGLARRDAQQRPLLPVPLHLRDAHYKAASNLGHGVDYQYPHDTSEGFSPQIYFPAQEHWGETPRYYNPVNRGFEKELGHRIERLTHLGLQRPDNSPP